MVEEKVKVILAEVLGIEEIGKVTMESHIIDDLAAESIDLVDICFRLEKSLGLGKVNPGDIFPAFIREEDIFDAGGGIKESVLSRLAQEYPHVEKELKKEFLETKDISVFLRTKNVVRFVEHKMDSLGLAATN